MKNKKALLAMRVTAAIVTLASIYLLAPWKQALYYLYPLPSSMEGVVEEIIEQDIDGVIVYIKQKDKPAQMYAAGWHNRQARIPAYPQALFKIASIAKLYDAAAVAKLVADNKLSLQGTLSDYLPELGERIQFADSITLEMLVQHRSGIPNFTDHPSFNWGESSLDVMSLVLDMPADFEPGEDYAYSNSNYLLLQTIMTAVLGYSYERYIEKVMLEPLGLTQTYFSVSNVPSSQLMSGYHVGYEDDFKFLDQGYVATAEDVGIFVQALNDGTLFSEQESKIYSSLYEYEHTGWVLGYISVVKYHPALDATVVLFINTTGEETILYRDILYGRIVDLLAKQKSPAH
ncbi:class A beta-lactamase-related serine hydrolase [Alteromonas sediminis]|uniref:Class A beta-lactamase-related serine hydrolase n=1 Tax=Alteromonas sediminis TaxID=2259342 RepID=A0A3N5Z511_9ALTE|nr:serine hydrolase domain-containing protein [Alteromonas sediminis]RPJ65284.1 class A beta-lactamase-related serine hydrolase [Alteromonas sediminis]